MKAFVNFVFHEHDNTRAMVVTTVMSSLNVECRNHENVEIVHRTEIVSSTFHLSWTVVGRHYECDSNFMLHSLLSK